ncbi:MAG TPA: ABC transporter permease [Polaromonas sp.]|uniref:ABC transporter permease n=1 Tax=Polaromonas sp. UBA4122 TaxID=1947074 RepID=UPI000EE05B8E|nr:FtsX-like permease family protein [Polaromonas sp. UBA4122]HAL39688.1 ABC transporter permease [Polaromonas sp.]
MMTWSLAVRNLLRNRRRSLATLLAMAIGSTSILLFGGFSTNVNYELHTRHVQKGGHLQIQHRDFYLYGSGNPTAYGIADYTKIMAAIQSDEVLRNMLLVVTPTLQFGGIAANYAANVSRTIIGNGFVAEDINRMRRWNDFDLRTKAPASALEGAAADAAVVGTGVARVLQLCDALKIARCPKPEKEQKADSKALPDDIAQLSLQETTAASGTAGASPRRIEVLVVNARGAPNVTSLEVIRAEDQGVKELDEVYVMMHLAQLQKLIYGKSPPRATSIMIQLRHSDQIPAALVRLAPILAKFSTSQPLAVLDFRALNPFYVQTMQMFDTIFGFVFVLIGGIVLFTVSNTMNTTVVERTVEIGTLRAIGLRRSGIRRLFVTEGALLGLCGAVLGVVLALVLSVIINQIGMPWLPPGNVELVPFTVNVWGENRMILGTTFGLICIAILSAWWPAHRAARLDVVEALRHV